MKRGERLFFCRGGKEDDGSAKGVLHWERTKGFSGFGFWRRGIFGLCTWFDFEEKKTWEGIGNEGEWGELE